MNVKAQALGPVYSSWRLESANCLQRAQLKTGVDLHLAKRGTDYLLCQQRKLGVPALRKRVDPGYLIT